MTTLRRTAGAAAFQYFRECTGNEIEGSNVIPNASGRAADCEFSGWSEKYKTQANHKENAMWRIIIVLTLCILAAACSPAESTPADEPAQPQQLEAVGVAMAKLAAETGLDPQDIQLIKVEDEEWMDSCLGLGGPAESCLLVITPGYRVTLEADGTQYVYRTDETGSQVRLEVTTE